MKKFLPKPWLREVWPFFRQRAIVLDEYRAAGAQMRYMLTDIALRGGLYSALPRTPGDVFGDGINEGRRLLALEIFELAHVNPEQVRELIAQRSIGEAA